MLKNDDALTYLDSQARETERSQSAYWREEIKTFDINAGGTMQGASVLGMMSRKRGLIHRAVHWVLQAPFRRMGRRFSRLGESLALGGLIARRQDRAYTYDLLRHSLTLALVRHFVPLDRKDEISLVIGDGFGMMASHLLLAEPKRKVATVNLTKVLLLDLVLIRQAVPGVGIALVRDRNELAQALADPAIQVIAVQADNADALTGAPIGLAINIVSMQEMEPAVVADYFRILRSSTARDLAFYCCNKLWKRLSDGTEVMFNQYPWHDGDRIVLDETCTWSQWVYSKTPPFWHHRTGEKRVVWHRLAWMDHSGAA